MSQTQTLEKTQKVETPVALEKPEGEESKNTKEIESQESSPVYTSSECVLEIPDAVVIDYGEIGYQGGSIYDEESEEEERPNKPTWEDYLTKTAGIREQEARELAEKEKEKNINKEIETSQPEQQEQQESANSIETEEPAELVASPQEEKSAEETPILEQPEDESLDQSDQKSEPTEDANVEAPQYVSAVAEENLVPEDSAVEPLPPCKLQAPVQPTKVEVVPAPESQIEKKLKTVTKTAGLVAQKKLVDSEVLPSKRTEGSFFGKIVNILKLLCTLPLLCLQINAMQEYGLTANSFIRLCLPVDASNKLASFVLLLPVLISIILTANTLISVFVVDNSKDTSESSMKIKGFSLFDILQITMVLPFTLGIARPIAQAFLMSEMCGLVIGVVLCEILYMLFIVSTAYSLYCSWIKTKISKKSVSSVVLTFIPRALLVIWALVQIYLFKYAMNTLLRVAMDYSELLDYLAAFYENVLSPASNIAKDLMEKIIQITH